MADQAFAFRRFDNVVAAVPGNNKPVARVLFEPARCLARRSMGGSVGEERVGLRRAVEVRRRAATERCVLNRTTQRLKLTEKYRW